MTNNQLTVQQMTCARIPTEMGEFQLCYYRNNSDDKEHLALVMGEVAGQEEVIVRVHSECFTGDVLNSLRCDCGPQLQRSIEIISQAGAGIIIYLRQEGRGIGLLDKLRAYNLQDDGFDTVEANLILGHQPDSRDYTIASLILQDLGVKSIRLLTNNPQKIESLHQSGIRVKARIPLQTAVTQENAAYLKTKVSRLHHMLDLNHLSQPKGNNGHSHHTQESIEAKSSQVNRPFITVTFAQSLDGSITTRRGETLTISGPESLKMTHQLRAQHDAILVGIGTILADDPQLTVRLVDGPDPQPIIIDSQLRFPLNAKLLRNPCKPWIATTEQAPLERQVALEALGAVVICLPANMKGQVNLIDLMQNIYSKGIKKLMVEGGAATISSFINEQLVDRVIITIAPILIGGLNPLISHPPNGPISLPKIEHTNFQKLGDDIVMMGDVVP